VNHAIERENQGKSTEIVLIIEIIIVATIRNENPLTGYEPNSVYDITKESVYQPQPKYHTCL